MAAAEAALDPDEDDDMKDVVQREDNALMVDEVQAPVQPVVVKQEQVVAFQEYGPDYYQPATDELSSQNMKREPYPRRQPNPCYKDESEECPRYQGPPMVISQAQQFKEEALNG